MNILYPYSMPKFPISIEVEEPRFLLVYECSLLHLADLTRKLTNLSSVFLVKLELIQSVLGDLRLDVLALSLTVPAVLLCFSAKCKKKHTTRRQM